MFIIFFRMTELWFGSKNLQKLFSSIRPTITRSIRQQQNLADVIESKKQKKTFFFQLKTNEKKIENVNRNNIRILFEVCVVFLSFENKSVKKKQESITFLSFLFVCFTIHRLRQPSKFFLHFSLT